MRRVLANGKLRIVFGNCHTNRLFNGEYTLCHQHKKLINNRFTPVGKIRNIHGSLGLLSRKGCSRENLVLYDSLSGTYKDLHVDGSSTQKVESNHYTNETKNNKTTYRKGLAWYTCGPTVYDSAHLGHARTYVCMDILHRLIIYSHEMSSSSNGRDGSAPPIFIMNITDVDDKILARAKEQNRHPLELARYYESEFMADLVSLNVRLPTVMTRVSEHVESDIIPYIQKIMDNGMAYVGEEEGGVYFDVRAFEKTKKYGKLAPTQTQSGDENEAFFEWGRNNPKNMENDTDRPYEKISTQKTNMGKKRDRRDFALWKFRKDGEDLFWDSPWGQGRPGWHIECSAMIEAVMKKFQSSHTLQVHAGGIDLKFPHHTNEIAQAEAFHHGTVSFSKKEWIPHWVHTGHLHIQGSKMSKSLKNFITIREMLNISDNPSTENGTSDYGPQSLFSSPADDFRLWCLSLSGSYRGLTNYSETRLDEARIVREKIVQFVLDTENWLQKHMQASSDKNWSGPNTRKWRDEDYSFYQSTLTHSRNAKMALLGRLDSETACHGFDMDGSTFLKELLQLIQIANSHMKVVKNADHKHIIPSEPIQIVLSTVRDLLDLVGFSCETIRPGGKAVDNLKGEYQSKIRGGEECLVEKAADMRRLIRESALSGLKSKDNEDLRKYLRDIMTLCDKMRDKSFPSLGIEIFDEKKLEDEADLRHWRWCKPLLKEKNELKAQSEQSSSPSNAKKRNNVPLKHIAVEDMFRVGQYEDMFLDYDETGLPLTNADGSSVSKSLKKKLLKKRGKLLKKS